MKYETWPCLQWHHLRPQQLELKTTSLKLKKESKDIKLEHIWVSRWTICSRVVLWAAGFDKEEDRMEWNKTISLVLLHRFLSLKKKKKKLSIFSLTMICECSSHWSTLSARKQCFECRFRLEVVWEDVRCVFVHAVCGRTVRVDTWYLGHRACPWVLWDLRKCTLKFRC